MSDFEKLVRENKSKAGIIVEDEIPVEAVYDGDDEDVDWDLSDDVEEED